MTSHSPALTVLTHLWWGWEAQSNACLLAGLAAILITGHVLSSFLVSPLVASKLPVLRSLLSPGRIVSQDHA